MNFRKLLLGLLAISSFGLSYMYHYKHCESLNFPFWETLLLKGYLLNGAIALGMLLLLVLVNSRKTFFTLGNFLLGTLLKGMGFSFLIYPLIKEDGATSRPEFFTFFIPYLLSLFWETYFFVRRANSQ